MKFLISGAAGFVGKYLIKEIQQRYNNKAIIIACSRNISKKTDFSNNLIWEQVDFSNSELVFKIIKQHQPDFLINLAADSSLFESWQNPGRCLLNNFTSLIHILDAIRLYSKHTRILAVGSSEVYKQSYELLTEKSEIKICSPYNLSRITQEYNCQFYLDFFNLNIVKARPFTHIGPAQSSRFVLPSFIGHCLRKPKEILQVGNIEVIRDFTDVRDVVKAYLSLVVNGKIGEVYNVCSGIGHCLRNILDEIFTILGYKVEVQIDQNKLRPNDNIYLVGSNRKIYTELGWKPQIDFIQTLRDMIDFAKTPIL